LLLLNFIGEHIVIVFFPSRFDFFLFFSLF
jgi:hypothetical protein